MQNIRVGNWMFYPEYGRFADQRGKEFFIDKRLNKLLTYLLNRKESIAKRSEILENVWDDVQVNEENLTKGVFDLRKLLKQYEIDEIEITTIRNVGYRLQIKEKETRARSMATLLLKSALTIIFVLSFLVMFIRAIRY